MDISNPADCEESHQEDTNNQTHAPIHQEIKNYSNYIVDRYNHHPQRSSSSNISSYSSSSTLISQRMKAVSPTSTTATTTSVSTTITSDEPSTTSALFQHYYNSHIKDEFSIESALSLYQAFASSSISEDDNDIQQRNCAHDVHTNNLAMNVSQDETSFNTNNNNDNSFNGNEDEIAHNLSYDASMPNTDNVYDLRCTSQSSNDDDSTTSSSTTSTTTPNNTLLSYTNRIIQNRKKIGRVVLSVAALWVYTQLTK